ncbi:hypothetical protein ABIF56_009292 [Bradyrhizobium elkanii]
MRLPTQIVALYELRNEIDYIWAKTIDCHRAPSLVVPSPHPRTLA